MKSEYQLEQKIAALRTKIVQLEAIARRGTVPGPMVTGRSNYKLGKRLDAENRRRAKAFTGLQKATNDLRHYEALLANYRAGEVHLNGQPRADSSSRRKRENRKVRLSEFMRSFLQVGDDVAVNANRVNRITLKRLSKKTVTDSHGERWEYDEIWPLNIEGEPVSDTEFIRMIHEWDNANA